MTFQSEQDWKSLSSRAIYDLGFNKIPVTEGEKKCGTGGPFTQVTAIILKQGGAGPDCSRVGERYVRSE